MMSRIDRKARFAAITRLGCVVCLRAGYGFSECEIHHLLTNRAGFRRNTDAQTIGLCPQHHRLGNLGVAIHAGKRSFERAYGTELELLNFTNNRILSSRVNA